MLKWAVVTNVDVWIIFCGMIRIIFLAIILLKSGWSWP